MAAEEGDADEWEFENDDDDEYNLEQDLAAAGVAPITLDTPDLDPGSDHTGGSSALSRILAGCTDAVAVTGDELDSIRTFIVETLRKSHGVTAEAADRVLQYCDWDLEDAMTNLSTLDTSEELELSLKVSLHREASDASDPDLLAALGGGRSADDRADAGDLGISGEAVGEEVSASTDPKLVPRKGRAGRRFPAEEAARGELMCEVCFNMLEVEESAFALRCNHWFCRDCFSASVNEAIGVMATSQEAPTCPQHGCEMPLSDDAFRTFLSPERLAVWVSLRREAFVRGNPSVAKCPSGSCELYAYLSGGEGENVRVECPCSREYCFGCRKVYHAPLGCDHTRIWIKRVKMSDGDMMRSGRLGASLKQLDSEDDEMRERMDSRAESYDATGHKRCPNPGCRAVSIKESGCMFVACPTCSCYWCWQCGQWNKDSSKVHHVYHCENTPDPKWAAINDPKLMIMNLDRFSWYYERFSKHRRKFDECPIMFSREQWIGLDKRRGDVGNVVDEIERVFVDVKNARRAICWAFALSFFLKEGSIDQLRFRATMSLVLDLVENMGRQVNGHMRGPAMVTAFLDSRSRGQIRNLQQAMCRSTVQLREYEVEAQDNLADAKVLADLMQRMHGSQEKVQGGAGEAVVRCVGGIELVGRAAASAGNLAILLQAKFLTDAGTVAGIPARGGEYVPPWVKEALQDAGADDDTMEGWKQGKSKSSRKKRLPLGAFVK